MGRHSLPTRPRARHAAHRAPARLGVPATMTAALLVALPGGLAGAEEADDPPPAALDDAATVLGGVLGTGGAAPPADDESADGESADGESADGESADDEPADGESADDEPADDEPGGAETGSTGSGSGGGSGGSAADSGGAATDLPAAATVSDLVGAGLPGVTGVAEGAPAAPTGAATDPGARTIELEEENGSGVSGEATIDPEQVVATASGLDPDSRYVSFFYGATSSATNANPCILDGTNPLPSDQTIGEWEVDEDGDGTLRADNPLGERYGLQAGTMSIREVQHDFSSATALPVQPLSYTLVACGEVGRIDTLDPVTDAVPKLPSFPSVSPLS